MKNPYGLGKGLPKAWRLGFNAGRDGLTAGEQPYRRPGLRFAWGEGWKAGVAEAKRERVGP